MNKIKSIGKLVIDKNGHVKFELTKDNPNNYFVSYCYKDGQNEVTDESGLTSLQEAKKIALDLQKRFGDNLTILEIYRDQPNKEQGRQFTTLIKEII